MKKTLNFFKRKTSQEQQSQIKNGSEPSDTTRSVTIASNDTWHMNLPLSSEDRESSSSHVVHKRVGLANIPESPDLPLKIKHPEVVTTGVALQHGISQYHTPAGPSDSRRASLQFIKQCNTNNTTSRDAQIHRDGFAELSESEQQMESAMENIRKLIEAEEQYSQALMLLKALNLYLLTDQTFTISRSFPSFFTTANSTAVLDDPDRSSAAVYNAWLKILPYHLRAICRAADSSNVRDKHDLESVVDVSAEHISAAEPARFVDDWSHAEQRARMTAALAAMRNGLPDLVKLWNLAVRKMKEEEVLGDLRKVVDGMKGRRTGRVFT
ncbi:hypothetical protein MMC11_001258 [Xylographa trunciseda]|nr:hypothetical protein [Xylographa trunciseda]